MTWWIGVILGIVIMQLATWIVAYICDENEDILLPFSVFLFYPFILIFNKIYNVIRKRKRKKKLKKKQLVMLQVKSDNQSNKDEAKE